MHGLGLGAAEHGSLTLTLIPNPNPNPNAKQEQQSACMDGSMPILTVDGDEHNGHSGLGDTPLGNGHSGVNGGHSGVNGGHSGVSSEHSHPIRRMSSWPAEVKVRSGLTPTLP